MGNFNEMISISEKDGCKPVAHIRMTLFRNFLNDTGLMDLDLKGNMYTWASNPCDGIVTYQKIDRIIVKWSWRDLYPHAVGIAMPIINSDHSPIVLLPNPPARCARFFKYENFWGNHVDCRGVVSNNWACKSTICNWSRFQDKAKNCKRALLAWHNGTFKNTAVEISKLKLKLQNLLNNGNSSDNESISTIRKEVDALWKQAEMYWGQRSRLKWLSSGDKNSKFFHATTVQRRDRNKLQRIQDKDGI